MHLNWWYSSEYLCVPVKDSEMPNFSSQFAAQVCSQGTVVQSDGMFSVHTYLPYHTGWVQHSSMLNIPWDRWGNFSVVMPTYVHAYLHT